MKRILIAGAGLSLLSLAGCAAQPVGYRIDYLKGRGVYPPQPYVEVIDHTPTLRQYVPIARIQLNGNTDLTDAQVLTALEQKAKALGANAVIVNREQTAEQPQLKYNPSGGQYTMALPTEREQLSVLAIHLSKRIN